MDATEGVLSADATIAGYAHEEGRSMILCVNKWDAVKERNRKKFLEQIQERLKFLDYAPVVFLSALTGKGTSTLFPLIKKGFEAASHRIGTGELNRFIENLRWEYRPKIKYLTQASIRPPTFVVFTDRTGSGKMHFSAERHLANRLRENFDFSGTPVVVKTKRAD